MQRKFTEKSNEYFVNIPHFHQKWFVPIPKKAMIQIQFDECNDILMAIWDGFAHINVTCPKTPEGYWLMCINIPGIRI